MKQIVRILCAAGVVVVTLIFHRLFHINFHQAATTVVLELDAVVVIVVIVHTMLEPVLAIISGHKSVPAESLAITNLVLSLIASVLLYLVVAIVLDEIKDQARELRLRQQGQEQQQQQQIAPP
jgi:uncharacterized membrane-anchored protein YitT (DUF2179 family)